MQRTSLFFRIFHGLLAALLLMVSVAAKSVPSERIVQKKTEKSSKHSPENETVIKSVALVATTATPANVHFSGEFYLLPPSLFGAKPRVLSPSPEPQCSFRLPHLEVLFEHFIVTNAP